MDDSGTEASATTSQPVLLNAATRATAVWGYVGLPTPGDARGEVRAVPLVARRRNRGRRDEHGPLAGSSGPRIRREQLRVAGEFQSAPPSGALCLPTQLDAGRGSISARAQGGGLDRPSLSTAGEDDEWQGEAEAPSGCVFPAKPFSGLAPRFVPPQAAWDQVQLLVLFPGPSDAPPSSTGGQRPVARRRGRRRRAERHGQARVGRSRSRVTRPRRSSSPRPHGPAGLRVLDVQLPGMSGLEP